MKPEPVTIPCGDINLLGLLHVPAGSRPFPAVAVCHPHPLYGGDMENNVVVAICEALAAQSIAALRFNFRRDFGGGVKEQEDVKAALDFLSKRTEVDAGRLGLAGYSFGGAVAFAVAQTESRVKTLALVSPALKLDGWEQQLRQYAGSKIVLLGEEDAVVPYAQLKRYFGGDTAFQSIPGADHFWWGCEGEVGKRVGEFFGGDL